MYNLHFNTKCQKQNVFIDIHTRIIYAYRIQIKKITTIFWDKCMQNLLGWKKMDQDTEPDRLQHP